MSRLSSVATLLPLVALAACVDNDADAGMVILRNVAPAEGCVASTDSDVFQSSGKIQVDSPYGYLFTPLIRNDMTTLEGQNPTQRTIFIESIDATVDIFEPEVFTLASIPTPPTSRAGPVTRCRTACSTAAPPPRGPCAAPRWPRRCRRPLRPADPPPGRRMPPARAGPPRPRDITSPHAALAW
jgi:hypothetical protein